MDFFNKLPIPQRFKEAVGKAKRKNILQSFLRKIVIYSEKDKQIKELGQDDLKEAIEICYQAEKHLASFPKTVEEEAEALAKEDTDKIPEPPDNLAPKK